MSDGEHGWLRLVPRDDARLLRVVGRRGLILVMIGVIWWVVGIYQLIEPIERFSEPGPGGLLQFMDDRWTGWVWIAAGALAVWVGARHRRGTRDPWEPTGYAALVLPVAASMFFYIWSALLYAIGYGGNARAVPGMCINAVTVTLLLIIAGWQEGVPPAPRFRRAGARR